MRKKCKSVVKHSQIGTQGNMPYCESNDTHAFFGRVHGKGDGGGDTDGPIDKPPLQDDFFKTFLKQTKKGRGKPNTVKTWSNTTIS